jgi:hypothetical protein
MKKTWQGFIPALLLASVFFFGAVSCGCGDDDDDDDSGGDTDDDDSPIDDDVDDDADDDIGDDADDDADDDSADDTGDDDVGAAPVLTSGAWDPASFTWTEICGDEIAGEGCTTLTWSICDADNNMLPGGVFYIYAAGTTDAFFFGGPQMPISDFTFTTTPDFSDCTTPVAFGLGLLITEGQFTSGPGDYLMACDIEAEDSEGNLSNKLTDIELTVTY